MDIKRLKQLITEEQILKLMDLLGADVKQSSNQNEILFRTVCHGGDSHKLYYYRDSKSFHCYSNCGQMDIISVVANAKGISISQSMNYICNLFNYSTDTMVIGFDEQPNNEQDWEILSRYDDKPVEQHVDMTRDFKILDESLLDRFYKYYHPAFYSDGIGFHTLYKFGIRYDILGHRIIIPHRDEGGNLIAIRCRNLDEDLVDMGFKYMPITIDGKLLSAKTSNYLYALYYNQESIKYTKKIILFESEKAVMQLDTILEDNNIGVALSSSSLSLVQVELIKSLGVEEVIIALDKEYHEFGSKEEKAYARKIRKGIINKLLPYFNVSVIWDTDGVLEYKQSPTDKGQETFFYLYERRIKVQ